MEDIRNYEYREDQRATSHEDDTLRMIREVEAASQDEEVPFHVPRD